MHHDTRFLHLMAFGLAFGSLLTPASSARAQSPGEALERADSTALAEHHAEKAYEAYRNQRYGEAIALYRQAYDTFPSADMLYNIARIYDIGLRERSLAITFYRRFVADPGAVPERIRAANARIAQLKAAQALAAERSQPAPAPMQRRARPASGSPRVDAGGESFWSPWRTTSVVAGAAGVVALGVGAGYGLSALREASTAEQYCEGNACRDVRGVEATYAAQDRARFATLGFAAGGGLVVASALLLFLAPDDEPRSGGASLGLSPVASSSQLGLQIGGKF